MNDDINPVESTSDGSTEPSTPTKRIYPGSPGWVKKPETEASRLILEGLLNFRPPIDLSDGDGDEDFESGAVNEDEG